MNDFKESKKAYDKTINLVCVLVGAGCVGKAFESVYLAAGVFIIALALLTAIDHVTIAIYKHANDFLDGELRRVKGESV